MTPSSVNELILGHSTEDKVTSLRIRIHALLYLSYQFYGKSNCFCVIIARLFHSSHKVYINNLHLHYHFWLYNYLILIVLGLIHGADGWKKHCSFGCY